MFSTCFIFYEAHPELESLSKKMLSKKLFVLPIVSLISTISSSNVAMAAPIIGGATTIQENQIFSGIGNVLSATASVIPPASGTLSVTPPTLVLPIIGGDTTTEIDYAGGVAVNLPQESYTLTNFVDHLSGSNAGALTVDLTEDGTVVHNLVAANVTNGNQLTLGADTAAAIQSVVGGPDETGLSVGTITTQLETSAVPEPAEFWMMGAGFITLGALRRLRTHKL
jgi:hypothetical protein